MKLKSFRNRSWILLTFVVGILLIQSVSVNTTWTVNKEKRMMDEINGIKGSDFWNLSPIHIDNNWSATESTYDWCTGLGIPSNPYIIENVTIDAQNSETCIYIENTNEYFIIQNCTLLHSQASPNAAIRLDYVSNGKILDNNVTNNNGRSISLLGGSNNLVEDNTLVNNGYGVTLSYSNDNKILKNYIQDSDLYGIYLWDSDNNYISENEINHCGYYAGGYHGIYISESASPSYVDSINNTIQYNNVYNNRKSGIYINSCDNNTLFGNFLENNVEYGIYLFDSDDVNIIGNKINDNILGCIGNQTSLNIKEEWNVCNDEIEPFNIDEMGGGDFTWDQISQFAWCSGSGTLNIPYVLENLSIDAQSIGSCIIIENSYDKYFIIRGCTIINGQATGNAAGIRFNYVHNGTIMQNTLMDNYIGIYLDHTENITIVSNDLIDNLGQGIIVYQSDKNYILDNYQIGSRYYGLLLNAGSNDNIVNGNTFQNNTGAANYGEGIRILNCQKNDIIDNILINNDKGIRIEDNSDNNTVKGNVIENNSDYGAYVIDNPRESNDNLFYLNSFNNPGYNALDNGTNTKWDNGSIGNYWSDYGGVDANDDVIGDNPHPIPGSNGGVDNYPIWDDGDDIFPIVHIMIPLNNSKYNSTAPSYSINIIEDNLDTIYYEISGSAGDYFRIINNLSGSIDETLWDSLPSGTYTLTVYANDTGGNLASDSVSIVKESSSSPTTPPTSISYGPFYLIFAMMGIASLLFIVQRKFKTK